MSFEQAAIAMLLVAMLAVFALDRFRTEIVSIAGLAVAVALGVVPAAAAFAGFSSPAFVTVVEILLIVQVLSRTTLLDGVAGRILRRKAGPAGLLALLCAVTAAISLFINNIGALALMIPVSFSVCRAAGLAPRAVFIPISYAALLGGLGSAIGTPANLILSRELAHQTGTGFALFDFAWSGFAAIAAGVAAIVLWSPRILPLRADEGDAGPSPRRIVSELAVLDGGAFAGAAARSLPLRLHGVARNGAQLLVRSPGLVLAGGDRILVETDWATLRPLISSRALGPVAGQPGDAPDLVAAVVMPESTLVGSRIGTAQALATRGVGVFAVSLRTPRIEGALADLQLSIGDVLYLSGEPDRIAEALEEAEMLALEAAGPATPRLDSRLPLAAFGVGIAFAALEIAPPEIAFGMVVLAMAASGRLNLRTGLADLNWPILIMLAAMIPLGMAVEATGLARLLADRLVGAVPAGEPMLLALAMLVIAAAITPFVNNATTAIILGPIALGAARAAGVAAEPLLMAVALGASIDFLTPFGHHNNVVAMGLGNYRFSDFARVGWPVTLAAGASGALAIWMFWA